jgi:hypothetical protein
VSVERFGKLATTEKNAKNILHSALVSDFLSPVINYLSNLRDR